MSRKIKSGKHVILTFGKDGAVESVSVSTPLEIVYEGMFSRAEQTFHAKPSALENGIQLIIFGCFWVEARTNNVTQEYLWRSLGQNPIRELVWQQFKKASIIEKLKVIGTLCNAQEANELGQFTPRIRKAFELRNRLAHFRAEEEPIHEEPNTVEQVVDLLDTLPDTQLVTILTDAIVMSEHATALRDCANWLEEVRSSKAPA